MSFSLDRFDWPEYKAIEKFYRFKTALRSSVPYMYHIEEGLQILFSIGAGEEAQRAYCLHPMFQDDSDLFYNVDLLNSITTPHVAFLAAEYRNVANDYISPKVCLEKEIKPRKSPLYEVNDMLVADKVQNRYEFEMNHMHTHSQREVLKVYFAQWLKELDISEEHYQQLISKLPKRNPADFKRLAYVSDSTVN